MTFTEVDRLGGYHDPHAVRWKDHIVAARARAMEAIRAEDAPSSRRIVTGPTTISARETALTFDGSGDGGSTAMAANSTASSGSGNTNFPRRASHAVVAVATGARKVWRVSIESRASASLERQILGGAVLEGGELANHGRQFYLDNIAIHMSGMAAEQVFVGHLGDGVASDLNGATRIAIILDRNLGMNGMLASWLAGVHERLIDSARRVDGPLLKRIEPVLQEQLARAKTTVESYRTSIEALWLELIGVGHLTGQQIVDGLKPDDRRKCRRRRRAGKSDNGCTDKGETA
ncbi:hypothetical protein E2F50_03080 [Rhizobium deserti]|uniref:Peptidase M41 domain-containing protein n=1 Tax=Rhizobium deserti TaxID=2547961 RepID=A0A4R5UMW2_9HYPH|nr:hypothetical protein [Rhizobium deserti]TDK39129.1 hypothetical protein E2F50_03080 [Rhizobium deserti]